MDQDPAASSRDVHNSTGTASETKVPAQLRDALQGKSNQGDSTREVNYSNSGAFVPTTKESTSPRRPAVAGPSHKNRNPKKPPERPARPAEPLPPSVNSARNSLLSPSSPPRSSYYWFPSQRLDPVAEGPDSRTTSLVEVTPSPNSGATRALYGPRPRPTSSLSDKRSSRYGQWTNSPSQVASPNSLSPRQSSDAIGARVSNGFVSDCEVRSQNSSTPTIRHIKTDEGEQPSNVAHGNQSTGDTFKSNLTGIAISAPSAKEPTADPNNSGTDNPRASETRPSSDAYKFDSEAPLNGNEKQPESNHNDAGSSEKGIGTLPKPAPKMSDKRGRRPRSSNMNAVQEAQTRGSLTSLHDLIERATRLASNLERGQTASRIDLPYRSHHNTGSFSRILDAFPPPGSINSARQETSFSRPFQKSPLFRAESLHSEPPDGQETPKPRRRWCGMAPWLFMLVVLLTIAVILVAVLVPVFLVVVPRQKLASDKLNCDKTPCHNGGVSFSNGTACSCVCAEGFTGPQCSIPGDSNCATVPVAQVSKPSKVTIGGSLPRLLDDSESNFNIPLNQPTILSLFSKNNVSCATENSLVSFPDVSTSNGDNKKRDETFPPSGRHHDIEPREPYYQEPFLDTPEPPPQRTITARAAAVATTNGIIYESSHNDDDTSTNAATATATATNPPPTTTPTHKPTPVSERMLDFSRVSVLFIFEKTGLLHAALDSRREMDSFMSSRVNGSSISGSSGNSYEDILVISGYDFKNGDFTLDYERFLITMPNGTIVGGRGPG